MSFLFPVLLSAALANPAAQEIQIALATPKPLLDVRAETTWLGETRTLKLVDDGSSPGDTPRDGIFTGRWTGAPVRTLAIRLVVLDPERGEVEVYAGLEPIAQPIERLSYALETSDQFRARRISAPFLSNHARAWFSLRLVASVGWACLVFLYIGWLVGRGFPVRGRR